MFFIFKKYKKLTSVFLTIFFVFSCFFVQPQKARAFWGVMDVPVDNIKVFLLDTIASTVAKVVLQKITASTVEWINNGFEGNPSYITDPEGFLTDVGDEVVGKYIMGDVQNCKTNTDTGELECTGAPYGSELASLCSPFSLDVRLALLQNFTKPYSPECTLSDVVKNIDTAVDDLSDTWDWNSWLEITQNPNNNAYGAYMEASYNINKSIQEKQDTWNQELDWGQGFKPFKQCEDVDVCDADGCRTEQKCENVTMGTTIANQLDKSLGLGQDTLVVADSINQIVSAALTQIITAAMSSEGVRGLSKKKNGSSSNSRLVDDSSNKESSEYIQSTFKDTFQMMEDSMDTVNSADWIGIMCSFMKSNDTVMKFDIVTGLAQESVDFAMSKVLGCDDKENQKCNLNVCSAGLTSCKVSVDNESGIYQGKDSEQRSIFKFDKKGGEYCKNKTGDCNVYVVCGSGSTTYTISKTSEDYNKEGFVWEPVATGDVLNIKLPKEMDPQGTDCLTQEEAQACEDAKSGKSTSTQEGGGTTITSSGGSGGSSGSSGGSGAEYGELCSPGKTINQGYSKDISVDGIRQAAYVFPNPGPSYGPSFKVQFSDGQSLFISDSKHMTIQSSKARKYQPGGNLYGIKTMEVYADRGTKPGSATLICP